MRRAPRAGVLASRRPCPPLRPDGPPGAVGPGSVTYISDALVRPPSSFGNSAHSPGTTPCLSPPRALSIPTLLPPPTAVPSGPPLHRAPQGRGPFPRGGDAAPLRPAHPPHAPVRGGREPRRDARARVFLRRRPGAHESLSCEPRRPPPAAEARLARAACEPPPRRAAMSPARGAGAPAQAGGGAEAGGRGARAKPPPAGEAGACGGCGGGGGRRRTAREGSGVWMMVWTCGGWRHGRTAGDGHQEKGMTAAAAEEFRRRQDIGSEG